MSKSVDRLFKIIDKIAKGPFEDFEVCFSRGKGWYVDFPDNALTHLLMKKRYYINEKSYSHINFLLNRYQEAIFDKSQEDLNVGFENLFRVALLSDIFG